MQKTPITDRCHIKKIPAVKGLPALPFMIGQLVYIFLCLRGKFFPF